jgi:uncharacterized protein with PhoU and TrkA domain
MEVAQPQDEKSLAVKYKECPRCKQPIMKCRRYMNQINQTLNDINDIKRAILEADNAFAKVIEMCEAKIRQAKGKASTMDPKL